MAAQADAHHMLPEPGASCPAYPKVSARRLAFGLMAAAVLALSAPAWADPIQEALRERIEQLRGGRELRVAGGSITARRLLPAFYEARGFRPAWTRAARRQEMLAAVEDSRSHGLDPADYQFDALRKVSTDGAEDAAQVADRDLLFTEALVRLIYHLHFGKVNPRELYPDWNFSRNLDGIAPAQTLEDIVNAVNLREAVALHAPQLDAYERLRAALAHYRGIAASGGWPEIVAGPTLRPGMRDPRVTVLRARLQISGDWQPHEPTPEPDRMDDALAAAVSSFQFRHGLEPDGLVGRRTRAEMNVAVARRIDQIRVNLERLRWVAQDLSGDYLMVDAAGFQARLYLDHRRVWTSHAVVGRPFRMTPVFRATMQYLVLNPPWVVPPTIMKEDLLPHLAKDRSYLAAHGMHVVDNAGRDVAEDTIDWSRYRRGGFPYQVVQAPGPENPLGEIKFMLPNPYAVYLHDTPAKSLFGHAERAFSSGCIRLEKPLELAVLLLDDAAQWSLESLRAEIATGKTRTIPVRRRVSVMMLYFTVSGGEDGSWHFRPDLYGRDPKVLAALARPFRFSSVDAPAAGL